MGIRCSFTWMVQGVYCLEMIIVHTILIQQMINAQAFVTKVWAYDHDTIIFYESRILYKRCSYAQNKLMLIK